jgi:hypothetical protein
MDLLKAASVLGVLALASVTFIHFREVRINIPGLSSGASSPTDRELAASLVRAPNLVNYQLGMRLFGKDGKPLFWYAKGDAGIELYDAPGSHPRTGKQLLPITREVADQLERCKSDSFWCS